MSATICVIHSRGLRDKAVRYAEELRDGNGLVCVISKKVNIKDAKGKFLCESDILQQKVDIVKSSDEVHVIWDGECSEVPLLLGAAIAGKKKIITSYVSPVSVKRFLWEKRPVKKDVKNDKIQNSTKKNS
jgi:hypothetical protein